MSMYMNELNRLKQRKEALLNSKGLGAADNDSP